MSQIQTHTQTQTPEQNQDKLAPPATPPSPSPAPEHDTPAAEPLSSAPAPNPETPQSRAERNRANAQHSTGPRTARGKARSRQNALKHGATARMLHTRQEHLELHLFVRELTAYYQPADPLEADLLNRIAFARQRYWRQQTELAETERAAVKPFKSRRPIEAQLARLAVAHPEQLKPIDRLLRYGAEADRAFLKTMQMFGAAARRNRQLEREDERWQLEKERRDKLTHPDLWASASHSISQRAQEMKGLDPSQIHHFLVADWDKLKRREAAVAAKEKELGLTPPPEPLSPKPEPEAEECTPEGHRITRYRPLHEPPPLPADHPLRRNPYLPPPDGIADDPSISRNEARITESDQSLKPNANVENPHEMPKVDS